MSDNLDDDELDLEEASFDEFEKKDKTLGDLWQENSLLKVGAVGVLAVAVFGAIMMFGGEDVPVEMSVVSPGADVSAPPGTEEASPAYIAAVEEENEARIDEAYQQGGSALPTPIDPPVGRLTIPEEEVESEDPLQRWRQLQEERLQRELQQTQPINPEPIPQDTGQTEAVVALADIMSQQMQAILEGQSTNTIQSKQITSPSAFAQGGGSVGINGNGESNEDDDFFEDEDLENFENVLLPAGEILYAQLLTEANSDIGGAILAQIVSGPLSGSRIIGSFEKKEELLVLSFETVIIDGVSTSISAIAIDPDTTLSAMATDVDHRYLQRVFFPMAAAFVEGAAEAISESGRTTVTIQGESVAEETEETDSGQEIASGVTEAGQELREILDDMADVEVLVRVQPGTPMGILFLEPVVEDQNNI